MYACNGIPLMSHARTWGIDAQTQDLEPPGSWGRVWFGTTPRTMGDGQRDDRHARGDHDDGVDRLIVLFDEVDEHNGGSEALRYVDSVSRRRHWILGYGRI